MKYALFLKQNNKHYTDINSTTLVAEISRTKVGKSYFKIFSAYGKLANVICANGNKKNIGDFFDLTNLHVGGNDNFCNNLTLFTVQFKC